MKVSPLIKIPVKFGIFGGILMIIAIVVMIFFEGNPILTSRILGIVILLLFIFFSIKEFRDYHNNRELHFWQGVSIGIINILTISIISSTFIYIYTTYFDQQTLITYINDRVNDMITNKENLKEMMGEEVYENTLRSVKGTTSFDVAYDVFIKNSFFGLLFTIIISVILRRVPAF